MNIVRALVKLLLVLTFAAAVAEVRRLTKWSPAAPLSGDQWPDVPRNPEA